MSIFDLFRSEWSSVEMTENDRQNIFWFEKRKSSYTAWKALSDSWDEFAKIFERQVREQPHVPHDGLPSNWGTHWERSYREIVQAQALYEEGLTRLLKGDRTVFLYNNAGVFDYAYVISEYWYSCLVNHGMHGDKFFEGKYVPELTDAIIAFSKFAQVTAGVQQHMMAEAPAPDTFSRTWIERIAKECQIPSVVSEVPDGSSTVRIFTGCELPLCGIYEPQIRDGCMNYLLAGVPAPTYIVYDKRGMSSHRPVTWRLLWEDDRYVEGGIPPEEKLYFPASASIAPTVTLASDDLISASSDQVCPKTGIWALANSIDTRERFEIGDKFPLVSNRDVVWVWVDR